MDNSTSNSSNDTTPGQHFSIEELPASCVVCFAILFLVLVLDILTSVAVLRAPSLRLPIKALILNLLIANILYIVTIQIFLVSILVLAYNQVNNPNAVFCRLIFGASKIITVERLFILATFSAVVLAIVIRGISFITPLRLFFSIAVGWVLAVVINIDVFVPQIFILTYVDNIVCFPKFGAVMHADVKVFLYVYNIGLKDMIPCLVCLVIPIVTLCISHQVGLETREYSKGLAKFSLFLAINLLIDLLGTIIPLAIASEAEPLRVYITGGFALVTAIPTSILTIIFLKPVRKLIHKQLKQCLSCLPFIKMRRRSR